MITFACACGKSLKVREELAGKKVKCPGCAQIVPVPQLVPVTVAPSQPSTDGGPVDPYATIDNPNASRSVGVDETLTNRLAAADHADFLSPPQASDEIGRLGPYRVLKVLGKGGMGMVLEAEDPQLKRRVALKVMLPRFATDADAKHRFLREAQAAAALEHDHIITIYQVGEDRVPFLAMPLLKGESLADCLKREGKLPIAEVLRIGAEIADGLAAAHDAGLIHRDIKPANVWLEKRQGDKETRRHGDRETGRQGETASAQSPCLPVSLSPCLNSRVKILDFGLARPVGANETHLTASGVVIGTPAYMAPEQARGARVDSRVDLFSLGCVLYQMAGGQLPFKGNDTFAILTALAVDTPADPREHNPEIPPELSALILQLLAKNPDERPRTASEVLARLRAIRASLPSGQDTATRTASSPATQVGAAAPGVTTQTITHAPTPTRTQPAAPKRRVTGVLIAVGAILLLCGGIATFFGGQIIRVATNQGELIVVVDDPTVELKVVQNGLVVFDKTSKREFTLKAGNGEIEVLEKDGIKLATKQFELTRGGKTTIKVTLEELAEARKPKDPDRRAAEWVLSVGGSIQISDSVKKRTVTRLEHLPISDFKLISVELHGRQKVTDAGLMNLKDCTNLEGFTLYNTEVTDAGLGYLKGCKKLKLISVPEKISDAGLEHFKDCSDITQLALGKSRVSNDGLALFRDCKNLTLLRVEFTKVTNSGLAHFKDHKSLVILDLRETEVTDEGLALFSDSKALQSVNVSKAKVTEAGVKKLAAKLPGCKIESDFGVFGPTVSADPDRRAAEWVLSVGGSIGMDGKSNYPVTIKELALKPFALTGVNFLENPKLVDADLARFNGCKNLKVLGLDRTQIGDPGLANLRDVPALAELGLEATKVTDAGLGHLKVHENLAVINLVRTPVGNDGLAALKNCKRIREISLGNTRVTDAGLVHLKDMPGLTKFGVWGEAITDDGLAHLLYCKNLTFLGLKNTKVSADKVKKLSEALPNCKIESDHGTFGPTLSPDRRAAEWVLSGFGVVVVRVDDRELEVREVAKLPKEPFQLFFCNISNNTRLSDEGLAHFKDCKNLRHLQMNESPVSDGWLVHFKSCMGLKGIELNGTNITSAGLAHFKDIKDLREIYLAKTHVNDDGLAYIKDCKELSILALDNTKVTDAGLAYLANYPKLVQLSVRKTTVTEPNVKKLAGALPKCKIESDFGVFGPSAKGVPPAVLLFPPDVAVKQITEAIVIGNKRQDIGLAFSPDGMRIACTPGNAGTEVFDVLTGKRQDSFHMGVGDATDIEFADEGNAIVAHNQLYWGAFDLKARKPMAKKGLTEARKKGANPATYLAMHTQSQRMVLIEEQEKQKGKKAVFRVTIHEARQDKLISVLDREFQSNHVDAKFSPSGRTLITRSSSETGFEGLSLWDVETGKVLHELRSTHGFRYLQFSPDGKHLATFEYQGSRMAKTPPPLKLRLLDGEDLHESRSFALAGTGYPAELAFHPDNRRLAFCITPKGPSDRSTEIFVLDLQTGNLVLQFSGHKNGVSRLCFSPRGTHLASIDYREIRIWQVPSIQKR